jgi:anhydro-N-acetylmuramic acid kinase
MAPELFSALGGSFLLRAIGLMSGTSLDGIDIALVETDGERSVRFGPSFVFPYADADRSLLRSALADAANLANRTARPGALAAAEAMIVTRHAEAVEAFLDRTQIQPATVDVIGFHGQTVLHRPDRRLTIQIGDGPKLAKRLGIKVVYDFRAADVAAGGQGAPLVPIFHKALVDAAALERPVIVVNIGGVANLTFIGASGDPIACDTGPGNALLDDLMLRRVGMAIDRDGATAARGKIDEATLSALLAHPYFDLPPPKSLDRNGFAAERVEGLSLEDAAATLTAFTAASIAGALEHLPAPPLRAIVCGGGARNPTLMRALQQRLPCPLADAGLYGWSVDAIEAQAFAYLAVRRLKSLPITFPTTTGVSQALTGGLIEG